MKAMFTGKISTIQRPATIHEGFLTEDMVSLMLDMSGSVSDTINTAKSARLTGTLKVKQLVADELLFGSKLTITVDDEEVIELTDSDIISSEEVQEVRV